MTPWGKPGMNYGSNSTDEALNLPVTFAQSHMANKWQGKDWKLDLLLSFLSTLLLLTTPPRIFMEATESAISWLELQLALWLLIVIIPHFNEAIAVWNHLHILTKTQIPWHQSKCAQPEPLRWVWESAISYKGRRGERGVMREGKEKGDSEVFVNQCNIQTKANSKSTLS